MTWHRLAHWFGCTRVAIVDEDAYGWITRACVTCGKRYRPSPPCWPL